MKSIFPAFLATLVLVCMSPPSFGFRAVEAVGPIYIRAEGRIEPLPGDYHHVMRREKNA